jgi:hypothetical protein
MKCAVLVKPIEKPPKPKLSPLINSNAIDAKSYNYPIKRSLTVAD